MKVAILILLLGMLGSVALAEEITYTFKADDWDNLVSACEKNVPEKTLQGARQFSGKDAVQESGRRHFRALLQDEEDRIKKAQNPYEPAPFKDDAISVKKVQ